MSHERHCPGCGRSWTVDAHVIELFHRCEGGGPNRRGHRRRATLPAAPAARSELWAALVAAQGEDSIWRPL